MFKNVIKAVSVFIVKNLYFFSEKLGGKQPQITKTMNIKTTNTEGLLYLLQQNGCLF